MRTGPPDMRMAVIDSLRLGKAILQRCTCALYLALTEPRTWYATVVGAVVAAYTLSPLGLIPNAVPILGYLDEAIVLPAGIVLLLRLLPHGVSVGLPAQARTRPEVPVGWVAAAVTIGLWLALVLSLTVLVRSLTE